jgi:hypothetical protein
VALCGKGYELLQIPSEQGLSEFNKIYAVKRRPILIFPYTISSISVPKSPHGLLNEDELHPIRRKSITKMLSTIQYIPHKLENIRCHRCNREY